MKEVVQFTLCTKCESSGRQLQVILRYSNPSIHEGQVHEHYRQLCRVTKQWEDTRHQEDTQNGPGQNQTHKLSAGKTTIKHIIETVVVAIAKTEGRCVSVCMCMCLLPHSRPLEEFQLFNYNGSLTTDQRRSVCGCLARTRWFGTDVSALHCHIVAMRDCWGARDWMLLLNQLVVGSGTLSTVSEKCGSSRKHLQVKQAYLWVELSFLGHWDSLAVVPWVATKKNQRTATLPLQYPVSIIYPRS